MSDLDKEFHFDPKLIEQMSRAAPRQARDELEAHRAMMPAGRAAPPSHEPVAGHEFYRGPLCDEFGRIKEPFKCRDPKNARRTNPRGNGMAKLDDDAPWGCD